MVPRKNEGGGPHVVKRENLGFSLNLGFVLFYETQVFLKKSAKNSIFSDFFSKNQCFTLQNGCKWRILDEITNETTHWLFLENLTPSHRIQMLLHFKEKIFGRVCCLVRENIDFVLLGPHPKGQSPQENF